MGRCVLTMLALACLAIATPNPAIAQPNNRLTSSLLLGDFSYESHASGIGANYLYSSVDTNYPSLRFTVGLRGAIVFDGESKPDYVDEAIPHDAIKKLHWYTDHALLLAFENGEIISDRFGVTYSLGFIYRTRILLAQSAVTDLYWKQDNEAVALLALGGDLYVLLGRGIVVSAGFCTHRGYVVGIGGTI